jgi:hypothetical protein
MRCRCVGANVSPMQGMLSPAMILIKPVLLSRLSGGFFFRGSRQHGNRPPRVPRIGPSLRRSEVYPGVSQPTKSKKVAIYRGFGHVTRNACPRRGGGPCHGIQS